MMLAQGWLCPVGGWPSGSSGAGLHRRGFTCPAPEQQGCSRLPQPAVGHGTAETDPRLTRSTFQCEFQVLWVFDPLSAVKQRGNRCPRGRAHLGGHVFSSERLF